MSYKFTATHGVQFTEQTLTATNQPVDRVWAQFELVRDENGLPVDGPFLNGRHPSRVFAFETDDAEIAKRVRAVRDYGIKEV